MSTALVLESSSVTTARMNLRIAEMELNTHGLTDNEKADAIAAVNSANRKLLNALEVDKKKRDEVMVAGAKKLVVLAAKYAMARLLK